MTFALNILRSLAGSLIPIFFILIMTACLSDPAQPPRLPEPITVWSWWQGEEEAILNEMFDQFEEIYPGVRIIHTTTPLTGTTPLDERYLEAARLGLGPNLLIGRNLWIPDLADAGLIHPLSEETVNTDFFLSTSIEAIHYQDQLYGFPLALHTLALYYNRERVDNPPATLEGLTIQTNVDHRIAIPIDFYGALWGIQAFGGQVFDEEGRLVLDQGGLASWLGWLKNAQEQPNVILSNDPAELLHLFTAGEVDYYIGGSRQLARVEAALGEENLGVAPLPSGPVGPAGPMLEVETIMLNPAASSEQQSWALRLAEYLTNPEQQQKLITQEASRIPANARIRVDERLYPNLTGLLAQTETAVPLPNIPQLFDVLETGDDLYLQALEGVVDIGQAVNAFTAEINQRYNFESAGAAAEESCPTESSGTITLWHSWPGFEAPALRQLATNFNALCPTVFVSLTYYTPGDLLSRYRNSLSQTDTGPDLLLAPAQSVAPLAADGLIRNLDSLIEPELIQRYRPQAQATMMVDEQLYALPLTMETLGLYVNRDLVESPARRVDDLLNQASPQAKVALPTNFYDMVWALSAFGGAEFDEDFRFTLNMEGILAWLDWLAAAEENPNVILAPSQDELQSAFLRGDAAYFAGDASRLNQLQLFLGRDRVGVVPMPSGPGGPGRPFSSAEVLMLSPDLNQTEVTLALAFATYLTGRQSQTYLADQGGRIPTNANVTIDLAANQAIAGFIEQIAQSIEQPNPTELEEFVRLGNAAYSRARVVDTGDEGREAIIRDFIEAFSEATSGPDTE